MTQKYQKIIFLILFLVLPFSTYFCSDNIASSNQPNEIKLIYSTKIGRDVYKEGDRLGEKIVVYFNGSVEKYAIYYKSDDVLLNTSTINLREISELNELFAEFNFNQYPNILPRTNQIHWPSSGCFISLSQSEPDQTKEVLVIAFEDSKYYPNGFYEFHDRLKNKLSSFF